MILELKFLHGRYHATAWGRHVNEGVPEWPPAPFRVLRALVDAWYRKHRDIPAETVEALLRALSAPPRFRLPPARASHTRSYLSQNKEDPSDKKLVFDGFAVLDRGATVLMGWPGLALPAEVLDAGRRLTASLNYLGRSETWIDARLVDDREVAWNCVAVQPGPVEAGLEVVPVACVIGPDDFDARPLPLTVGTGKKTRPLTWFEALGWGSLETIDHGLNRPPAMAVVNYLRERDALDARPPPVRRPSSRAVEVVLFAAESRVPVPMTDALLVGEQVRRNLLGALKRVAGATHDSIAFTGKDRDGRPARGHPHATIMCLDEDHDGSIDAVLIVNPTPFTVEERRAIDRLAPVPRRNGHPLVLTPGPAGRRDEMLRRVSTVTSVTPYAPQLHWKPKRDGDFDAWLARQVIMECEQRGLPRPIRVVRVNAPPLARRRTRWLDFRRARKADSPQPAFGLELHFAEPVLAPFSLGYASHYGLGTFAPLRAG
jgi:CRISPR-associated protein Csb2